MTYILTGITLLIALLVGIFLTVRMNKKIEEEDLS